MRSTDPTNTPGTPQPTGQHGKPRAKGSGVAVGVLVLSLLLILAAGTYTAYIYFSVDVIPDGKLMKVSFDAPTKLDAQFTDTNGDLVADAPSDPSKLIDPDVLFFTTLGSDLSQEEEIWKDFVAHLGKVTGKKVELQVRRYQTPHDVADIREGNTHLQSLNTGSVPIAVNLGGYVPLVVMADTAGKYGYEMEILVPKDSPVQTPKDLKGKRLAVTSPYSLSSYKAPLVLLQEEFQLTPVRDYELVNAGMTDLALKGVANKQYAATAVASDFKKRILERSDLPADALRAIHTSKPYPPACFGHTHLLKPELAAKVREAFLTFPWEGTSLEKAYQAANQSKFVPINYKDDYAGVRQIDEKVQQLAGGKK